MQKTPSQLAIRVALFYGAAGAAWVVASARLWGGIFGGGDEVSLLKGGAFVAVTSVVLFIALRFQLKRWERERAELAHPEIISSRLAAIVESTYEAIISKDMEGMVTSWNKGAEKIFGFTAGEMIGAPIMRLVPPGKEAEANGQMEKMRRGENVEHYETVRLTRDGRLIDVSITGSPITDAKGGIIGTSEIERDVTARTQREREVVRLSRLYAALGQVNEAIIRLPDRDEMFQKVCSVLVEYGGFSMAWIGWHDAEMRCLKPIAQTGDETGYLQEIDLSTEEGAEGRDPFGTAFRGETASICNDMLNDPATLRLREEAERRPFRALGVFPIRMGEKACGTLTVYADEPGYFQAEEVTLLTTAAADVSFALDKLARDEARQLAEYTLRHERDFSDALLNSLPGVFYLFDKTGSFLRWNKNFEQVSGYSAVEIATMRPLEFFAVEDRELVESRIEEVFTKGASKVDVDFVTKDGRAIPYHFTGILWGLDGEACLVGVGIDLTERKEAEEARWASEARYWDLLRQSNATLEQKVAQRTEELQAALIQAEAADRLKSAFLATMSHELRTPLNSIIGFTGIILQGMAGPLTAEQSKQLGMVKSSGRHLLELINDVLDLSKIEAGEMEIGREAFDLRKSLDRVAGLVKPQADKKKLSIAIVAPAAVCGMVSDRRRVEQILLNLLNNAIKFTERGGVTLTAEPEAEIGTPPVPAVRLRVADTGIGVKPEDMATLFQPFRQIDTGLARRHEGTGLGLAICRRLATLLGGEIVARSEWQRGSEFIVTIPLNRPGSP
jgi:PAS domain S-box-containing protein